MERPSGVSSPNEDSMATLARYLVSTSFRGMKLVAWRLPIVIVPVLSSSNVSMSPASSTALPLLASTLADSALSMPASPIAESKAPMVVGIRQTSRATKVGTERVIPKYLPIGQSVPVTIRNARVNPASVTVKASSFGVFCRTAPSTSAIIRSRNEFPAETVIFTIIRSEITLVPPTTPDRSPPASLTTGADSPVMADSSTIATPSTTSPSPGISSPAETTTRSPSRRSSELTCVTLPS